LAAFEDAERGRIARGYRADLTLLSRDITKAPAKDILTTQVEMTLVGGETAYERRP
jgi:predicted amidohydrolase YtcJ